VEMVRSIGADQVVDYTQEDFTKSARRYDVILDCVGNHSFSECTCVMNPRGIYVGAGGTSDNWMIGPLTRAIKALVLSWFVSQKQVMVLAKPSKEDLTTMVELMAIGKVTPVIDKRYSLGEVPEAVRYLEAGHARGKVVITVD